MDGGEYVSMAGEFNSLSKVRFLGDFFYLFLKCCHHVLDFCLFIYFYMTGHTRAVGYDGGHDQKHKGLLMTEGCWRMTHLTSNTTGIHKIQQDGQQLLKLRILT